MEFSTESSFRSLRGGSGGGGRGGGGYSGGSYSGGSSYRGSSYGGSRLPLWFYTSRSTVNGGTEEDRIATWVWIVLALIILLLFGCCYYRDRAKNSANESIAVKKDSDFDAAVSEARRNIAYSSSPSNSCDVIYQTYGGIFDSGYSDRGKTFEAELKLRFVNDGSSGYTIEGEGNDADGTTKVTDGFITYGGNAWWLEETFSGQDTGLKILSKGTFDFSTNTFTGTWRSSSKFQGKYVSFVGRSITKTLAGGGEDIPVVQAEAEHSIPVAFATMEEV
jgi:hypothetical protein